MEECWIKPGWKNCHKIAHQMEQLKFWFTVDAAQFASVLSAYTNRWGYRRMADYRVWTGLTQPTLTWVQSLNPWSLLSSSLF
jgi:hypothetical protein